MIIDSHTHLFSQRVVNNVSGKKGLAESLHLETDKAAERCDIQSLESQMQGAGVASALLLPTAPATGVEKVNAAFIKKAKHSRKLFTAGTLHPDAGGNEKILFGTDWPWFHPENELRLVNRLADKAGFSRAEKKQILGKNIRHLL